MNVPFETPSLPTQKQLTNLLFDAKLIHHLTPPWLERQSPLFCKVDPAFLQIARPTYKYEIFYGADLIGRNLTGIVFMSCSAEEANFSETNIKRTNFAQTVLLNSDFRNASLDECTFEGAELTENAAVPCTRCATNSRLECETCGYHSRDVGEFGWMDEYYDLEDSDEDDSDEDRDMWVDDVLEDEEQSNFQSIWY